MRKAFIYKIMSPTGKIYIGSTIDVVRRIIQYRSKKSCVGQKKLFNSIVKYGWDGHKFELILQTTEDKRLSSEYYLGVFYNCLDKKRGLNLMLPKIGDCISVSDETKIRMSLSAKKKPPMSEETKKKISIIHTGRKRPPETGIKIGLSRVGKTFSDETKRRQSEAAKKRVTNEFRNKMRTQSLGKRHSDLTKEKLRLLATGREKSPETCEKIRMAKTGITKPGKLILNMQTGIYYDSLIGAAGSVTHLNKFNIRDRLSGVVKNKTDFILV